MSSNFERTFILSGRNTIIHKQKKLDLIVVNGDDSPNIIVSHNGIALFKEAVPRNRREAKERYLEVVNVHSPEVFGEAKTLLFIQALDGREYKVDYTKTGTDQFLRVHQDSYL